MTGNNDEKLYIGVDVGTGSVRAALVTHDGQVLTSAVAETKTFRDDKDHRIFEQSTTDIWSCVVLCVRKILENSGSGGVEDVAGRVKGIGFDATCSLAVVDFQGNPISVSKSEGIGKRGGERNIILWADHRAEKEAELINSTGSVVLDYVGGKMSLEMEVPKTLWLKRHMPEYVFSQCQFFDLPDWLTYHATGGCATRSVCSLACKCSYVPEFPLTVSTGQHPGWQDEFFYKIGLGEFVNNAYKQFGPLKDKNVNGNGRFPVDLLTAGLPVGSGLSEQVANELGLLPGTPVGSAVIDAYAGWVGTIAAGHGNDANSSPPTLDVARHRLAAVAGTSTCHLVASSHAVRVPGVWGPYRDVVFPGWWMNEGGQSSTGQLIDFMITTHPAYPLLEERAKKDGVTIHKVLDDLLLHLRDESGVESYTELVKDMHFYPDLHGNRSPIADPQMRGSITGLTLDRSLDDLARKFRLTLEAIALQTKHIISELNKKGHEIRELYLSGGQSKNEPLMRLLAAVCDMPVVLPASTSEAVTRGAAMLGRFAAELGGLGKDDSQSMNTEKLVDRLWAIMVEMTPPGTLISPGASEREKKILQIKFDIFIESIDIQKRWRSKIDAA